MKTQKVPVSMDYMLKLWQQLRQPFILPICSVGHHTCDWEKIDLDLFACKLCSNVHACRDLACSDVVETNDGTVCALSGVVIREKKYDENEYQDTIDFTDLKPSYRQYDEEAVGDQIEFTINNILNSTTTYKTLIRPTINKIERMIKEKNNFTLLYLSCCITNLINQNGCFQMSSMERNLITQASIKHCKIVFRNMVTMFGMPYKQTELVHIIVGILYLMRSGIMYGNLIILPKIDKIENLLPSETLLQNAFNVRAKYLTETENRIKFCLRSTTKSKLLDAGFKPKNEAVQ